MISRKSIQHMAFAALMLSVAMPTISSAMAHQAPRKAKTVKASKAKQKMQKLWQTLKNNWEYVLAGGCILLVGAAVYLKYKKAADANKPRRPVINQNDPKLAEITEKECPICMEDDAINMLTPCCKIGICRACWNKKTVVPEMEFEGRVLERAKANPIQQCPWCRKPKR